MGNKPTTQEKTRYSLDIQKNLSTIPFNQLDWLLKYFMNYPNEVNINNRKRIYQEIRNRHTLPNYDPILNTVIASSPQELSIDDNSCIICWEYEKTVVVNPCHHLIICPNCARSYRNKTSQTPLVHCPICRKKIRGMTHIYKS